MPARIGNELVYLSRADVLACEITPAAVLEGVERAIRGSIEFITAAPPLNATVGLTRFAGKFGATGVDGQAVIKWYGLARDPLVGRPSFWPLILMSDVRSGYPLAIIEGSWITGMRTAALTALAARALARPDASTIGFVGCGLQARAHLTFLKAMFPLRRGAAIARTRASAEHFSVEADAQGLAVAAVDSPRDAVDRCDIVVTTVPLHGGAVAFLDASWLASGSFAVMVDRGFSWRAETLPIIDRVFTDDLRLSGPGGPERLVTDALAGDLAGLLTGESSGRRSEHERIAFAFSGTGAADAGAAAVVYEAALRRGAGTVMPL